MYHVGGYGNDALWYKVWCYLGNQKSKFVVIRNYFQLKMMLLEFDNELVAKEWNITVLI